MKISIEYWGKHELTNFLQQDDRQYTGKVLYWFNSAAISSETLNSITDNSRKCLGERFTPEHHVELEVEKHLSCIGCDDVWKEILKRNLSDIFDLSLKIKGIINSPLLKEKKNDCNTINDIYKAFSFTNDDNILFEHIDELMNYLSDLLEKVSSLQEYIYKIFIK